MANRDSTPSKHAPDYSRETTLIAQGASTVAGVDEAGRGPLAGPVVTAAVILDPHNLPTGLNDSKKLTAAKRDLLFASIMATAQVGICAAPPSVIEKLNIRGATLWAMRKAVLSLPKHPCHALIDGRDIPPGLPCPADYLIKGDALSLSVAAASIVAKVARDRMCETMDLDSPQFGFAGHKGYGTAAHMEVIRTDGPCAHHRRDFAPIAQALLV